MQGRYKHKDGGKEWFPGVVKDVHAAAAADAAADAADAADATGWVYTVLYDDGDCEKGQYARLPRRGGEEQT